VARSRRKTIVFVFRRTVGRPFGQENNPQHTFKQFRGTETPVVGPPLWSYKVIIVDKRKACAGIGFFVEAGRAGFVSPCFVPNRSLVVVVVACCRCNDRSIRRAGGTQHKVFPVKPHHQEPQQPWAIQATATGGRRPSHHHPMPTIIIRSVTSWLLFF
jgi:hypothetical protein